MTQAASPIRVAVDAVDAEKTKSVLTMPMPAASAPASSAGNGFPVRIMHVFDRLNLGGTEKVVMKLVNGFTPGLFEHSICTLRGADPSAQAWAGDVPLLDAGKEGAAFQFNVLRLAKVMKTVRPAIVHSRNWGGIEAVWAARLAGVPVVIHSEHGYQLEMQDGLPLRQTMLRHMAYRSADVVFTVSDELRRYHATQAHWRPGAIRVLHNGVDTEKFQPRADVRARVRRHFGIALDAPVVGFVGRMVRLKDVPTLLRALETLTSILPDVRALLIGSGPELETLRHYAMNSSALNGRVIFCGAANDVPDLLNAMDVLVLPSLMEGMSNTLLEAMSTGVPVIATRVGGNPEVVEESVCGYLFQPGDAGKLGERLAILLQNDRLRRKFSQAARERAVSHFSLDSMLHRYHDLYLGLAKQRGVVPQTGNYVRN